MSHGGHGDMPMGPRCSMNMLWNTQIVDTCIVFRSWHISSNTAFAFSFIAIVALGAFYEYLRVLQRSIDIRLAISLSRNSKGKGIAIGGGSRGASGRSTPEREFEEAGLLTGRLINSSRTGIAIPPLSRTLRALLYGATVFLSFFLMLVFMTYNAYLISAVVVGAAVGHYIFGGYMDVDAILAASGDAKGMACH